MRAPPDSGNGGYVSDLLAAQIEGTAADSEYYSRPDNGVEYLDPTNVLVVIMNMRLSPQMEVEFSAFLENYPKYAETTILDDLRATEYERLDRLGHVYLDFTGGGMYSSRQLQQHFDRLKENVFGNPHSNNPTSLAMTELVERAREYVLEYFNASPDEYYAIFTPNASGALKLVGESYPFGSDSRYLLTFDNHNSVNGIREFARTKGAAIAYVPAILPAMHIDRSQLIANLEQAQQGENNLFAFPAQSNFSGVQYPLEMIAEAREFGWDVLLDAAAFVSTNLLDLSQWKPDFVAISFYKMFGYPTGVGCLLMRRPMLSKIKRPWFAGGTIQIASVQGDGHYLVEGPAAFEDGTVDYLNFPAVEVGLRHISNVGIDVIHERVHCLTGWLLDNLTQLIHDNGKPLVEIHGPVDMEDRGGTIAFNFFDVNGVCFDIRRIEDLANAAMISLRAGCFCNPGAAEMAYGLSQPEIGAFFQDKRGMSFDELRSRIRTNYDKEYGATRISVGLSSNFADAFTFLQFAQGFKNKSIQDVGAYDAPIESSQWMRDSA